MLVDMLPFSSADYPGKLCATLFFTGCNFRCGYCHNPSLVNETVEAPISKDKVLSFLASRRKLLDGVCLTGGEALLSPDLFPLLAKIKDMGYLIKLDTNGSNLDLLQKAASYLDFIAMDIKSTPAKYSQVSSHPKAWESVRETVNWLKASGIEHEFRTTVLPEWHTEEDLMNIRSLLGPETKWVLQQYRQPEDGVLDGQLHRTYSAPELTALGAKLGCVVRVL